MSERKRKLGDRFTPSVLSLVLSFLLVALTGCGPSRGPVSVSEEDDGIRLTLWSPHSKYEVGETVRIRATLENVSDHTIILESHDEPVFDIEYSVGGQLIYWSEQNPDLATNRLELKPGEKFETEIAFVPPKPQYQYATEGYYGFRAYWWSRQGTLGLSEVLSVTYGPYGY